LEPLNSIYKRLLEISAQESGKRISEFPGKTVYNYGLHQLTDQLPPPGKPEQTTEHSFFRFSTFMILQCWWEKVASCLNAGLIEPADLLNWIDHRELWRGGLVIREKKVSVGIFQSSLSDSRFVLFVKEM
ncbi:hypothetical protein XENOCAPTIV_015078, partial [Xenoophorus captivus]